MSQVDWGTADVLIAGVETTLHLFVLRLRHSGVVFARAYRNEVMECFLDGHREAFEWLGGIPRTLVYDYVVHHIIVVMFSSPLCGVPLTPPVPS